MLIRQLPGVVVFMAIHATECLEIPSGSMAIGTLVPFPFVFTTKNGEIGLVVLCKCRGIPSGFSCMADFAVGREVARFVVRTYR